MNQRTTAQRRRLHRVPDEGREAARKFYGETLGLPFGKQWGEMPAYEFETGAVTIALMQVDAFSIDFSPNSTPLEFHVDDFDAAKAELESRGVEFVTDVIDSGVCKQAIFTDPDGNALAIHHRYAEGVAPQESMDAAVETAQQ